MKKEAYGKMARFYDGAYEEKADLKDRPFYLDLAANFGGPILEIACGTGRILLPIARQGHEIWGIDYSDEQLAVLKSKLRGEAAEVQNRVTLFQRDMKDFSLDQKFKLIIIPFRPMQHLYTIEEQIQVLKIARHHLQTDGRLAFDVFFPYYPAFYEDLGKETLDFEWPYASQPGRTIKRYFVRRSVNKLMQYFEGEFIYRIFEGENQIEEIRAPLKLGYYSYPHLQLLFKHCHLIIENEYGNFQKDPIDICQEMIFVLRRA